MIIRKEQVEAFRTAAMRAFENEMVAHLAEFSPPLFKAIKEDQMRVAIRFGIARAAEYGITFQGPVRLYLELMLLFGSHFDSDPQYPWAAEILTDETPQMPRAQRLFEKTQDYRKNIGGPRDDYTLAALRRISAMARQPPPVPPAHLAPAMLQEMARVYPQKSAYVGEAALRQLIESGMTAARSYGFSTPRALVLPVVLMFAFGHGCCDDPLYPWIARTLRDEAITDSEGRAQRLEAKALTWLDRVLAYFDQEGMA
jgi:hypothetical protein